MDQKNEQAELLDYVAAALERRGIRYAVTGSHASIAYGENRLTNDIDVIVELTPAQLPLLAAEFPPGRFYISEIGARHAALNGGQFNIIDQDSLQKVDFIVPRDPAWPDQFARRLLMPSDTGRDVWFISPEDLILKKMDFYHQGGSERHLRDIASMLKISGDTIDRSYIDDWSGRLGLRDIWKMVLEQVG